MAAANSATRDGFHTDLRAALQTADTAVVPKTRAARAAVFQSWTGFCASFGHDASLCRITDPETRLCHLLVFGLRIRRTGTKQTGGPVRAKTVEAALLAIGEGITMLGGSDPRKQTPGSDRNHPLLASFLKALLDEDDPTKRAYPVNITIIDHMHSFFDHTDPPDCRGLQHTIDLCIVGFFWLLRPAEYLTSTSAGRSQAFKLGDIAFQTTERTLLALDPSLNDVDVSRILRATLTFTDQKNGVRGEQLCHLATSHPRLCPVKALLRICAHLRHHGAPPTTPIYTYYDISSRPQSVSPRVVTATLRRSAASLAATTGIAPGLISSRSLRPGGATALLCSGVDANIIQLLGRWKSDAMLRYLRVAAHAFNTNLAQGMLTAGAFTFAPGTDYATTARPLPEQTPAAFLTALQREAIFHDD